MGLALPADDVALTTLEPLLALVDYVEVVPEELWERDESGRLGPNRYHDAVRQLQLRCKKPAVGRGTLLSVGGMHPREEMRRRAWLARIAVEQAVFGFRWYSDHLGLTAPAGVPLGLPMPVPCDRQVMLAMRRHLSELRAIVPEVAVENAARTFSLGDPLDEPGFIGELLAGCDAHLVLDLHAVHATAINAGCDPQAYVARVPLERVIAIHVSGSSAASRSWVPSGRTVLLDDHDRPVPEDVWALLEHVLPRCPRARGVTLERAGGSIRPDDRALLADELRRLRHALS